MNNELVMLLLKEGYIVSLFEYLDHLHYSIGVPLENPVFGVVYVYFYIPEGEYYVKAQGSSDMCGIHENTKAITLKAWKKFDSIYQNMFDLIQ